MREGSSNRAYSFFIILFILTVAFSLTSAGIFKGNIAISIDADAKKSKESSGESSRVDSDSSNKSGGSIGSDSKSSSDNSNKEGSSGNKNNDQGTNDNEQQQQEPGSNDGSNTGIDNNLKPVEPLKTDKREQGTEPILPLDKTVTPSPPPTTSCEQGSTCTTHQQDLSNRDHSITTSRKDKKTPFILSIPFP